MFNACLLFSWVVDGDTSVDDENEILRFKVLDPTGCQSRTSLCN